MRITKLIGNGIKGFNFAHQLFPVTIFAGPNGSGKSTRAETLKLALLGYLPGVENKAHLIYERLASASEMGAIVEFESGHIVRHWCKNGKGVKYSSNIGTITLIPPEVLDETEFTDLSGPEKIRFLFKRAKLPDDLKFESVLDGVVSNVKAIKLEPHGESAEKAVRELARWIQDQPEASVQDWITSIVDGVAEKRKAAMAGLQRAVKALEQQVADSSTATPGHPDNPMGIPSMDAEAKLKEARLELNTAIQAEATAREKLEACRKKWTDADIIIKKFTGVSVEGVDRDIKEVNSDMALVKLQLETAQKEAVQGPLTMDELEDLCTKAVRLHGDANGFLTSSRNNTDRLQTELDDVSKDKKCPTCHQTIKSRKGMIEEATARLKAAQGAEVEAKAQFDTAGLTLGVTERNLQAARERQKRLIELQSTLDKYLLKAAELETKKASLGKLSTAHEQQRTALVESARLKADQIEAQKQSNQLSGQIQKLEEASKLLIAWRATEATRVRTIEEKERVAAEYEVLTQACDLVLTLQETIISKALTPFLATANRLCNAILRMPLGYSDGNIVFLGPMGKTIRIKRPDCSGADELMALAALRLALCVTSDSKFKIILIDEVGALDISNKIKLLTKVTEMVNNGEIDQVLLFDPRPSDYYDLDDGVELIVLGSSERDQRILKPISNAPRQRKTRKLGSAIEERKTPHESKENTRQD